MAVKWVAGGVGVAGLAWILYRNREREKLLDMMEESQAVFAARAHAQDAKSLAPQHAWLKEKGGLVEKADEIITYTNTTTAKDAFREVLQSLPKAPEVVSVLPEIIGRGVQIFEESTGMEVPREATNRVDQAVASEGGQAVDQALTGSQGLWAWLFDNDNAEARTNPGLDWDTFLEHHRM